MWGDQRLGVLLLPAACHVLFSALSGWFAGLIWLGRGTLFDIAY